MKSQLFVRKNRSNRAAARETKRCFRNRRLLLESLEDRRLLAFTDLAAIEGTLFYDFQPSNVQQPIQGETVSLYLDDGDNIFDDGVDTFVDSDVTDVDGKYRFDDLIAGTYFVVQPAEPSGNIHPVPDPVVVTIVITPQDVEGTIGLIIDHFDADQSLTAQQPPTGTPLVSSSVSDVDILGGHRQLIVASTSGTGTVRAVVNENGNSLFSYAESPGTFGDAIMYWDGTPGDHLIVNPTGLGGVDLTTGGTQDSFLLEIPTSDIPAVQTIRIYTDAANYSEAVIPLPGLSFNVQLQVLFSSFVPVAGAGADFSDVGAITFRIEKDPNIAAFGLDYQLHRIATLGPTVFNADLPYDVETDIETVKLTNDTDNNDPTGPYVPVGETVTWTYFVSNPGNESLENVNVVDDQPGVTPLPVLNGLFNVGDTNQNDLLDPGEIWEFTASGPAVAGQYENLGTATGNGTVSGTPVDDDDEDHYFGYDPGIDIEKATNGFDADDPTGPYILVGDTVTWTYVVTNTGNVALSPVVVVDDNGTPLDDSDDFFPTYVSGDDNNNGALDLDEIWIFEATGIAQLGQYGNVAVVTGTPVDEELDPIPDAEDVTDEDPSHYFGYDPGIDIEKATNGFDADDPTGPYIPVSGTVTWTYVVTNTGNVPLSPVVVVDDNGTPLDDSDDFFPTYVSGDDNNNGALDLDEIWIFEATGIAQLGQYGNVAVVTGTPVDEELDPIPDAEDVTDEDPSHYFGYDPGIDIEKATNGFDADDPTGPYILVGDTVTWTYVVTNTGNVALSPVVVVDDNGTPLDDSDDFFPTYVSGDDNNNGALDLDEIWIFEATGIAQLGQYGNVAVVTGTPVDEELDPIPDAEDVTDEDPSHYFGYDPGIDIEKATNGFDADDPTGPYIPVSGTVTWTYVVTNTGTVALSPVVVVDDNGTPLDDSDDFFPTYVSGDDNNNGALDLDEVWIFEATGIAQLGQYGNVAVVTGTPVDEELDPIPDAEDVTDEDPSHYFGYEAGIDIEKATNGQDADDPPGPLLQVDSVVTWTYVVTNTGNVPLSPVVVVDDNGTPLDDSDDFFPTYVSGDTNNNGALDLDEIWLYEATGIVQLGPYRNMSNVTGTPVDEENDPLPEAEDVTDEDPSNYEGVDRPPIIVIAPDKNPGTPQEVHVVNSDTGEVLSQFLAYEANYQGGTRIAVGDLNGDGIDEIVTAPGRSRLPQIRVFSPDGDPVLGFPEFLAYPSPKFNGGVHLTLADVDGDGDLDIITVPSYGPADVRVFFNRFGEDPMDPLAPAFSSTPDIAFRAFSKSSAGGFVVAAADMGKPDGSSFVNELDGRAEIVIGTGPGPKATVWVFEVSTFNASGALRQPVRTFYPFTQISSNYKGGLSLETAKVDNDQIPDIIVGMGVNGTSRIEVWNWNAPNATLGVLGVIPNAFNGSSYRAPIDVAAILDADGFATSIVATQGPGGTTQQVRRFDIDTRSPLVFLPPQALSPFPGPWFVAASRNESVSVNDVGRLGILSQSEPAPPPKFFVADDKANKVFVYGPSGETPNVSDFAVGKVNQRGITTTADGSMIWTVDAKKIVRVYNNSGNLLGSWTANKLSKPTGIATDGIDIWIVDQSRKMVYRFDGAASATSGKLNASSSFKLTKANAKAEGLTTDGNLLWVVDNHKKTDRVFVYNVAGQNLGAWDLDPVNSVPTGLTIDPTGVSQSIWIVDGQQAAVYEYSNARGALSGSPPLFNSFPLALGNSKPQGIADPDASLRGGRSAHAAALDATIHNGLAAAAPAMDDGNAVLATQMVGSPIAEIVRAFGSAPAQSLDAVGLPPTVRPNVEPLTPVDRDSTATGSSGSVWDALLASSAARRADRTATASDRLFADLDWLDRFDSVEALTM
ncbi:MAG: VCBS repeat-containing protein [Pirellulaceae bacterium]|nr:VCBS repeat-containing protein [Pirellulaceae bacterium]